MLRLSKSETSGRGNGRVFAFAAVSMLLFSGSGQMAQAAEGFAAFLSDFRRKNRR